MSDSKRRIPSDKRVNHHARAKADARVDGRNDPRPCEGKDYKWVGTEELANILGFTYNADGAWKKKGLCAKPPQGVPLDAWCNIWYPEHGNQYSARLAKAICGECPVREKCVVYSLDNAEKHGIWGGFTGNERSRGIAMRWLRARYESIRKTARGFHLNGPAVKPDVGAPHRTRSIIR